MVFTIRKKRSRCIEPYITDFSNLFFVRFLVDLFKEQTYLASCLHWSSNNRVHIQTANRRSTKCKRLSCKFNYLGIIPILDETSTTIFDQFFCFFFFHKKSIFPTVRKLNKNTLKIILEKSVVYSSMRLHLLFPMVKIAVLYLVAIKRYSKSTYEHSCYQHICERNRSYRNFIIMILVEYWSNRLEE